MLPALVLFSAVSFDAPADVASRLLPKLGVAAGMRLEADARAGRQVLLVHIKGMASERLLRLVADATGAVWEPIEGGYRLTLGSERLRALAKEEEARRQGWIAAQIAAKGNSPLGGAMTLVGSAALDGLGPGERIVWSSAPTSLQRPLLKVASLGADLAKGQVRRLETLRRAHSGAEGLDEEIERVRSPVATTFLVAQRGLDATIVSVRLSTFDVNGRTQASEELGLIPPDPPLVALSDADAVRQIEPPAGFKAWDADRRLSELAGLLHPETHEPLAFGAGPMVARAAEALGRDLVADLPDRAFQAAEEGGRTRLMLGDWLRLLALHGVEARLDGGTLVVRPGDRAQSALRRADRADLRRRIASLEASGAVTFDFPVGTAFEDAYLNALPTHSWDSLSRDESPDTQKAAAAWLALEPAQRDVAVRGGVSVPSGAPFWSVVRDLIARPENSVENEPINGLALEPTVFLAAPDPRSGVAANYEETPGVAYREPGDPFPWVVPDLASAARTIAEARPGAPVLRATFWPATHRHLSLHLRLGDIHMVYLVEEAAQEAESGTRLPNVFPALRRTLDRL